jgi:predicted ATPase
MRIAFSGTGNSGKTTLVKNFLAVWPNYKQPEKTYRDLLKEGQLKHSKDTTVDTQWTILNFMVDQLQGTTSSDNIVFDRCPLDNLVYTLWAYEKKIEGFDDEFATKCINIVKETMRSLDIIFLCRYDSTIPIENDGVRETNLEYIQEIDNIYAAILEQYRQNYDADIFFPAGDSPGFIELPTTIQQRIDEISQYISPTGGLIEEESILNPNNLAMLEELVKAQEGILDSERREKELMAKFGLNTYGK